MSSEQRTYGGVDDVVRDNGAETQPLAVARRDKRARQQNAAPMTAGDRAKASGDVESATVELSAAGGDDDDDAQQFSPLARRRLSSWITIGNEDDLHSLAESVFSDIRSESTATRLSVANEAEAYLTCPALQRAFPERSFALIVTLIFELPTLFLISGGSGQLCDLIGRHKYTTLVALLPLISAISGNVGLQASTLTTRAISHGHVHVDNYTDWLGKEVTAGTYLGIAIGVVMASIAFCMGGFSFPFAISIFTAQFIGIITAGFTGTLAPLIFTFIFERDSGKWGGPLETAVQDVVGSFAMIVVTYRIMLLFGPYDLDPSDMC
ncbi:hypothetical protein ACHAWF_003654 [Thalassiosira exigua]